MFLYEPIINFNIGFLSKYVGEQYMGNMDTAVSKLDAYFVHDLQLSYKWEPKSFAKSITFSGLVNNLFNKKYEYNGYYYTFEDYYTNIVHISIVVGTGYYILAGTYLYV